MRTSSIRRFLALGLVAGLVLGVQAPAATAVPTQTLVPIGSDYQPDTLQLFARQAANRSNDDEVHILVIPITYSLDAFTTTKSERKKNLTLADHRRSQVEDACNTVKLGGQACTVQLVPVLVRADAEAFDPAGYFSGDLDGMFVLGGDQTVAMNVVHDTPLEAAMTAAYQAGAAFGGNSAGDAVQSRDMINGYAGDNGPAESMREDAVQVCYDTNVYPDCEGGLAFGFPNLITDQHVFEYGRTGRSLNVALETGKPVLGMDAATGAVVTDYTHLRDVTGDTLGYVIDPDAFGAGATWDGPTDTLAMRDVALHLLPAGSGFDFSTMTPSQGSTSIAKPSIDGRAYPAFTTGATAGSLFLSGGILGNPAGIVGQAFVSAADGEDARIVVLAAGYDKSGTAQADAKAITDALAPGVASTRWFALDARTKTADAIAAIADATGIVVIGRDRSLVKAQLEASDAWTAARAAWAAGTPLLADDAAAAVAGARYAAMPNAADVEAGATEDAIAGAVDVQPGLGLVSGLSVEPRLLPDQLWPQLFQVARASGTSAVAAGIDVGTAIRIDAGQALTIGDSAVVVVDGRGAVWATGTNGAIGAAWLILDSFVDDGTAVATAP
jgi:cyanophycinase-like exopeptidase